MRKLYLIFAFFFAFIFSFSVSTTLLRAATQILPSPSPATSSAEASQSAEIAPTPKPDITQPTEETIGPLEKLLRDQKLGPIWPTNPVKYAIRGAVAAGVPANTIVLLLLLPLVAAAIAASRHLVGLRGFGIFLPAALGVTFVATGPVVGLGLFLVIVAISAIVRYVIRRFNIRLQYLPRMAMLLLFVVFAVLSVLFAAPLLAIPNLPNVSIFPVLILVLLSEDFSKVQLGKSAKTAISLTTETLILALVSYVFLTTTFLQEFALLNPEALLLGVLIFDFILGKYAGLRFFEILRFRKLLSS